MSNYKITSKSETWKNGITPVKVTNTKSNKEHKGFVYKEGKIKIMVGTFAQLKTITL